MAGHVVVRHIGVLGLEQDIACGTDQDRAKGVVAVSAGALRYLKGAAQECLVIKRQHGGVHSPKSRCELLAAGSGQWASSAGS